jgi:hypothetical protein
MAADNQPLETQEPTRRGFLAGLVAGSALLAVGTHPIAAIASPLGSAAKATDYLAHWSPAEKDVFGLFQAGTGIVHDWFIENATLEAGAIALTIGQGNDVTARVDICRKGDLTTGIESTTWFDLFLMNDGAQTTATKTEMHQAVRILAEVLRRSEQDLSCAPADLKTHTERLAMIEADTLRFPSRV